MTANIMNAPYSQFFGNDDEPLVGGLIYTYASGTNTPKAAYTDASGTTPLSNPIVLDAYGRAAIFLDGVYRIAVHDSNDVPVRLPQDGISTGILAPNSVPNSALAQVPAFSVIGNKTGATANASYINAADLKAMLGITTAFGSPLGLIATGLSSNTSTAATIAIKGGFATDSTSAVVMQTLAGFTWTVANGNQPDGYRGGTTLPNNTTLHWFIIAKSDLSAVASFCDTTISPTLPTAYAGGFYRRIFSLKTDGSGSIRLNTPMVETDGGSVVISLNTPTLDISTTTLGTSQTQFVLGSLPLGLNLEPLYEMNSPTSSSSIILRGFNELDIAPSTFSSTGFTAAPGADLMLSTNHIARHGPIITDTSGQIGARANAASTALYFVTRGFKDYRRA